MYVAPTGPEFDRLLHDLLSFVYGSLPDLALVVLPWHTGAFVNDEIVKLVCVPLRWNRMPAIPQHPRRRILHL